MDCASVTVTVGESLSSLLQQSLVIRLLHLAPRPDRVRCAQGSSGPRRRPGRFLCMRMSVRMEPLRASPRLRGRFPPASGCATEGLGRCRSCADWECATFGSPDHELVSSAGERSIEACLAEGVKRLDAADRPKGRHDSRPRIVSSAPVHRRLVAGAGERRETESTPRGLRATRHDSLRASYRRRTHRRSPESPRRRSHRAGQGKVFTRATKDEAWSLRRRTSSRRRSFSRVSSR
jgi:hypothetical protein